MDLRFLIYSKNFDEDTQQDLLRISMSSMWVEDLLDYLKNVIDNKHEETDEKILLS